jgi:tetratricopeptide (TPR) repeat protein
VRYLKQFKCIVLILPLLFSAAGVAKADTANLEDLSVSAIKAYNDGDFQKAAMDFEQLLAQGAINGHVYYNLGNTYYREGKTAEAVAAYLAARRFLPRDPDVRANLKFALKSIPDKLEPDLKPNLTGRFLFWVKPFTAREFAMGAAYVAILSALLLAASYWRPNLKELRLAAYASLILPALFLAGYTLRQSDSGAHWGWGAWGAVTSNTAAVRSGAGAKDAVVFELHQGAPFAVLGTRGVDYYQIQISDGKKGWIAAQDAKVFGEL